jgi:hypothetical protein
VSYCSQCGAPLDTRARASGTCLSCGASIDQYDAAADLNRLATSRVPARPRRASGLALAIVGVALIVAMGGMGLAISAWGGWSPIRQHRSATSGGEVVTQAPSAMPSPSGSRGSTPAPSATVSATGQPVLTVSPTAVSMGVCTTLRPAHFEVTNSGGGVLSWTASSSLYVISPSSGSLAGGAQVQVTVNYILLSGRITVTAPGALKSPQIVKITCAV